LALAFLNSFFIFAFMTSTASTQAELAQTASTQTASTQTLTISQPDDWHLHLRDGTALNSVVAATARQFGRAIVMPNLKPPVTTTAQAIAYRERILAGVQAAFAAGELTARQAKFEPLMTLYLTDNTSAAELKAAKASGVVHGVKLYPAGATTNSDAGVSHINKVTAALEAMQTIGLPLLIHGEATDSELDIFDREAIFIDRTLVGLRKQFPALKIVFEHITTKQAAQFVAQENGPIAATITPHHLLYNRNALFKGGMRPHWYCLPVLKREEHREALLQAATSGSNKFFLGTDSAPHAQDTKENACGCAGCYVAPHAMELYATAFESVGALDRLEGFASVHGPQFYGLPVSQNKVQLVKKTWMIPMTAGFAQGQSIVPLAAGESLDWKLV
jgi:dihydroorotase